MSRLDTIRAALARGYVYNAEQAEEHVRDLLAVAKAAIGGATLESAIAKFAGLAQSESDEYWREYFGRMRDALKELM